MPRVQKQRSADCTYQSYHGEKVNIAVRVVCGSLFMGLFWSRDGSKSSKISEFKSLDHVRNQVVNLNLVIGYKTTFEMN